MCRFALYLGPEITVASLTTEPEYSIIHQSYHSHEREEPLNGDGFGIAWFVPGPEPTPVVFKDVSPAWNNLNLHNLAPHIRSDCILAHVRAATAGLPVTQLNCHPFSWQGYAFMHNGTVGGFHEIRRSLLGKVSDEAFHWINGSTDSELVFALFTDRVRTRSASGGAEDDPAWMADALAATIRDVEEQRRRAGVDEASLLNLAVTDGRCAVFSRYVSPESGRKANSLYVHSGSRYTCQEGACKMEKAGDARGAVIVASEPLSKDPGWQAVRTNHIVIVREDKTVQEIEIG